MCSVWYHLFLAQSAMSTQCPACHENEKDLDLYLNWYNYIFNDLLCQSFLFGAAANGG